MGKADLEKRMAELEQQVAALRKKLDAITSTKPWWDRIAGTFENDPIYRRAMRLGREYRQAQQR